MYSSWDILVQQTEFFVILDHVLPWTQKIKIFKKWKKPWRYYHFRQVYHTWQSYDVWFLRYGAGWTEFFVILEHFSHFYPHNNPKNQNFEKMKKPTGDIIILHRCNIDYNHIIYGSWDNTKHRGKNFVSFWTIICTFTPLTHPKNHNFEKMKKTHRYIVILFMNTINDSYMMHGSWDMESNRQIFLSFWTVFCPFNNPKNQNLEKNGKTAWRYYHFTQV